MIAGIMILWDGVIVSIKSKKEKKIENVDTIDGKWYFRHERKPDTPDPLRWVIRSERGRISGAKNDIKVESCMGISFRECKVMEIESSSGIFLINTIAWKAARSKIYLSGHSVCENVEWSQIEISENSVIESTEHCKIDIYGGKKIIVGKGSVAEIHELEEDDYITEILVKKGGVLKINKGVDLSKSKIMVEKGGIKIKK